MIHAYIDFISFGDNNNNNDYDVRDGDGNKC